MKLSVDNRTLSMKLHYNEYPEGGTSMKLLYYPETSLYVEFKARPGAETIEVTEGLNVDIDADGEVVGFDIDQASRRLDLSTLETQVLPLRSNKAG